MGRGEVLVYKRQFCWLSKNQEDHRSLPEDPNNQPQHHSNYLESHSSHSEHHSNHLARSQSNHVQHPSNHNTLATTHSKYHSSHSTPQDPLIPDNPDPKASTGQVPRNTLVTTEQAPSNMLATTTEHPCQVTMNIEHYRQCTFDLSMSHKSFNLLVNTCITPFRCQYWYTTKKNN